jgi:alanine dehydrogenase
MTIPKTIGFPRMMKEPGEKRVFLPEFIEFLAKHGLRVFIEEGYGSRSGYAFGDTGRAAAPCVRARGRRRFSKIW